MRSTRLIAAALVLGALAACTDSGDSASTTTTSTTPPSTLPTTAAPTTAAPTTGAPTTIASPTTTAAPPTTEEPTTTAAPTTTEGITPASFTVRAGTEQVAILGAEEGEELVVVDAGGEEVAAGEVDEQGSLLFRNLAPGDGYVVRSESAESEPFTVEDPSQHPDADFYASQELAEGFGYITVRDGTTLSANVLLPGPAADGPYPTVVEYSGYSPSNPDGAALAQIYTAQGFAYIGVNMRGTGCSGGSFRFFETVQSLDGYDVIEAVAAQPWVLDNEVGMVGISYPGISQLFVAATQPPSLNSITPLSVIDDTYRGTLYPGGMLNTGFAVEWSKERQEESGVYGQDWSKDRADAGDEMCAANQELRLQNPDQLQEIEDTPYYTNPLGDSLAPITFVDQIEVPVFIAGAWQDEQTGGHFAVMLPEFTGSPHVYVTLTNGLHTESVLPGVFQRYAEFLQLYVGKQVPDMAVPNAAVPAIAGAIAQVDSFPEFPNRFGGMSYDEALAAFEAEPSVRINFEEGAADGLPAGAPYPRYVAEFPSWPVPDAVETTWFLGSEGRLAPFGAPVGAGTASYLNDPDALPATFYPGGRSSAIWLATTTYEWAPLPAGTGAGFITNPLETDTVIAGSGSVDLWIKAEVDGASMDDTDLEVTISEVRPDGSEVYIQSGWLRASQRALDEDASTDLRPVHTNLEEDVAPLEVGEFTPVRIEIFPFAHAFRAGTRIRLTVDAPGNARPVWEFDTHSLGETVTIAFSDEVPSKLVLPVVSGVAVPTILPACTSLRGQPCRSYVPADNGG